MIPELVGDLSSEAGCAGGAGGGDGQAAAGLRCPAAAAGGATLPWSTNAWGRSPRSC